MAIPRARDLSADCPRLLHGSSFTGFRSAAATTAVPGMLNSRVSITPPYHPECR